MSTPIYDALCETIPGPDGHDEEEAARRAQGTDGAAGRDGHASAAADRDGRASSAAGANGEVGTAHEGNGATAHNGRAGTNPAADGRLT